MYRIMVGDRHSLNICPSASSQGVRRAAMQPAKLYLERVLREVGNLGNSQPARANAVTLLRSALRLGAQVGHKLPIYCTPLSAAGECDPDLSGPSTGCATCLKLLMRGRPCTAQS
jgi:hypothetical protein